MVTLWKILKTKFKGIKLKTSRKKKRHIRQSANGNKHNSFRLQWPVTHRVKHQMAFAVFVFPTPRPGTCGKRRPAVIHRENDTPAPVKTRPQLWRVNSAIHWITQLVLIVFIRWIPLSTSWETRKTTSHEARKITSHEQFCWYSLPDNTSFLRGPRFPGLHFANTLWNRHLRRLKTVSKE